MGASIEARVAGEIGHIQVDPADGPFAAAECLAALRPAHQAGRWRATSVLWEFRAATRATLPLW
jgi:hypothetical protein